MPTGGRQPPLRAGELGGVLEGTLPLTLAVALTAHDGRLLVFEPADGRLRELARGADGEISDLCWSPDSAWLAYRDPVESGLSRIMMVRMADDTLVAVTEPRFVDTDPAFTTDGKYLAFLSRRTFDPIYDEHAFDLTFPASWRPFLVPLAARTRRRSGRAMPAGSAADEARRPAGAGTGHGEERPPSTSRQDDKEKTSRRRSCEEGCRGWADPAALPLLRMSREERCSGTAAVAVVLATAGRHEDNRNARCSSATTEPPRSS